MKLVQQSIRKCMAKNNLNFLSTKLTELTVEKEKLNLVGNNKQNRRTFYDKSLSSHNNHMLSLVKKNCQRFGNEIKDQQAKEEQLLKPKDQETQDFNSENKETPEKQNEPLVDSAKLESDEESGQFRSALASKYFVDKTNLIEKVLKTFEPIGDTNYFICGPRRWGKSTNLNMLKVFFSVVGKPLTKIKEGEEHPNKKLFIGKNIYKDHKELFYKHFGKYPVIYLDFSTINDVTPRELLDSLLEMADDVAKQYSYLLEDPNVASEYKIAVKYLDQKNISGIRSFFKNLCKLLKNYYKIAPVILIDEADNPIVEAIQQLKGENVKAYNKVIRIFKTFYTALLKTNQNRSYRILTGITRVANSTVFSTLQIKEYRHIDGKFSAFYSFTKEDVDNLLDNLECTEQKDQLKKVFSDMYNGYQFGGNTIYNCFSVIEALTAIKENYPTNFDVNDKIALEEVFKLYWAGTGQMGVITKVFTGWELAQLLNKILSEEKIQTPLNYLSSNDEQLNAVVQYFRLIEQGKADSNDKFSKAHDDIIYSFFVVTGYLTAFKDKGIWYVKIPNNELRTYFVGIQRMVNQMLASKYLKHFRKASEAMEELSVVEDERLKGLMDKICAYLYYDTLRDNKSVHQGSEETNVKINEYYFYNFISGLIPKAESYFRGVDSRLSSGKRPDIYYINEGNGVLVLIEVKHNKNADEAFKQAKKYCVEMIKESRVVINKVIRIGINFDVNEKEHSIQYKFCTHEVKDFNLQEEEKNVTVDKSISEIKVKK